MAKLSELFEQSTLSTEDPIADVIEKQKEKVDVGPVNPVNEFIEFQIINGEPTLVDGENFDVNHLKDSVLKILNDYEFTNAEAKGKFINKVCQAFQLPTSIVNDLDVLENKLDSINPPVDQIPLAAIAQKSDLPDDETDTEE